MPALLSSHEFVDCLVERLQLFTGGLVVGDAVLQVIFQNDLGRAAEGGAHRSQLDEHLGTVAAILDHALNRLQMSDRTGQAVEHCLCLGV